MNTDTTSIAPVTEQKQIAVTAHRASNGGNEWIWPINIYFALVPADADGKPVFPKRMTDAADWARIRENARATKRVAKIDELGADLAKRVNDGEMSFAQAKEEFRGEDDE